MLYFSAMEEPPKYAWLEETLEEVMAHDSTYWHSRTPTERLHAVGFMRQKHYGYDPATAGLQRVLEIVKLERD
jgi:hypothetical protein